MYLSLGGHFATGDISLDVDIRDIEIMSLPGGLCLMATTGSNGGLVSWNLSTPTVTEIDRVYYTGAVADAIDGLVDCVTLNGTLQVLVAGTADAPFLGYGLGAAGAFTGLVQSGGAGAGSGRVADFEAMTLGSETMVFAADAGNGALLSYTPATNGDYRTDAGLPTHTLGGPAVLTSATVTGTAYLLATDPGDQGVNAYRVATTSGALTQTGTAIGFGLADPTALEVVTAFGKTWVIVGAAGSASLSVLHLSASGELTPVDHVIDGLTTRFDGVHAMSAAQVSDRVFIVAGGSDDGLSLFTLLPDGRLLHLESLEHSIGAGLMNVGEIDMMAEGARLRIFVTSGTEAGITEYQVDLSTQGLTGSFSSGTAGDDMLIAGDSATATLSGGEGDDFLIGGATGSDMWGGTGSDRFVLQYGTFTTRIMDFSAGSDWLDLSGFPMLRAPTQLQLQTTSWGARIAYGDAKIELHSVTAGGLELSDIFGSAFTWPDHILIAPPPPGVLFIGGAGADVVEGSERDDTLRGGGGLDRLIGFDGADELFGEGGRDTLDGGNGNDTLDGGAGDDRLSGGPGSDILTGGDDNDTISGQDGDDSLMGAGWHDELWGGGGNDTLLGGWGHDTLGGGSGHDLIDGQYGHDRIAGGPGNDTIYGNYGDDSLSGDNGNDQVWGAAGNDTLRGGGGSDVLGGFTGDDLVFGDAGHDIIWGNAGNDLGFGGWGADTLGGGDDQDTLHGEGGNDLVWGGNGSDSLFGGYGADTVGGFVHDDWLSGDDGNDEVWGNSGNDYMLGGNDDDTLGGGSGNDTLYGGSGNDEIRGGFDDDRLWGGTGADVFQFYANHGNDRILDFDIGADRIWIAGGASDFATLQIGQTGADVVIRLGAGQIFVANTDLVDLTSDHFLFG